METLSKLAQTMERMSLVALGKMRPSDLMPIQNERLKLIAWLGGDVDPGDLKGDRILNALQQYHKTGYVRDLRQARLLCYGCTQAYTDQGLRLLESHEQLDRLLRFIEHHSQTRPFRKCYRGLLNAYFSYDPNAPEVNDSGRSNWFVLREFLQKFLPTLTHAEWHTPEWVQSLTANRKLLTVNPCVSYCGAHEGIGQFEAARLTLDINADSWLVRTFVQDQINHIVVLEDEPFQSRLDAALLLLDQFPLYIRQCLGLLLDRYCRCAARAPRETLRHFAVVQWGAPWLPQNAVNWLCSTAALNMVASWTKQYLVRQFFNLFAQSGADNSRRAAFWNLYSDDLHGMYFALGNDAFDFHNRAFLQFREDAKGLVVRLNDSKHNLHAVILQFATHHVVEFSQEMNAAFFYDITHGTPQFYLSKGWVDVGALSVGNALKENAISPHGQRMAHIDYKLMTWEGRFAQELGNSELTRQHFCERHIAQYYINDGQAWIKPHNKDRYTRETASILLGWGYIWSPEAHGYFHRLHN